MDSYSDPSTDKAEQLKEAVLKERRVSLFARIERLLETFSPFERLVLYFFSVALGLSTLALLAGLNTSISVDVPAPGGSLTEGETGPVRFINPILTLSQADEDMSALIFSGLVRTLPDGSIVPDLASHYDISADGTVYTFTLRSDATFHDGTPVTSADVLYTIGLAQNPDVKSPHRADWEGVSASAPDAQTIVFTLPRAYAPFIQNATLGILPEHLWRSISAEEVPFSPLNTRPVGSGAFRVSDIATDNTGSVTSVKLVPFQKYTLGAPYLRKLSFVFYPNEAALITALNEHRIDAVAGVLPEEVSSITRTDLDIMTTPLPRLFGVFYNQNHAPVLTDIAVRAALDAALDKQALVDMALGGYGVPIDSPIPPGILSDTPAHTPPQAEVTAAYSEETLDEARAILKRNGWSYNEDTNTWTDKKKQTISFTLATADSPQLVATANAVAAAWNALGADVTVRIYPISDLNTTVIRPRQYDAILFGEIVGRELDLFAFWHSSQRNDPGLNLALYTNASADKLLSEARATSKPEDRAKLYQQFADIVAKDRPATFLYVPEFIYAVPSDIHGVALGALTTPAERFLNAHQWYTDTEHVWSFFTNISTTE